MLSPSFIFIGINIDVHGISHPFRISSDAIDNIHAKHPEPQSVADHISILNLILDQMETDVALNEFIDNH